MGKINVFPYEAKEPTYKPNGSKQYWFNDTKLTVKEVREPIGKLNHGIVFEGDPEGNRWNYGKWDNSVKNNVNFSQDELPVVGQTYVFNMNATENKSNQMYPWWFNIKDFTPTNAPADNIQDVIQSAKDFEEKPTVTPSVQQPKSSDDYVTGIRKGMAFNNFTTILGSGLIAKHLGDQVEKQWLTDWKHQYDKAKLGEEIYTDEEVDWGTDDDEEVETI
jgi:hypothetical protein